MNELRPILAALLVLTCVGISVSANITPDQLKEMCGKIVCYNKGKCVYDYKTNKTLCSCRTDGDTIYGGDHCETKGTHLRLPLTGIIGIAAGGGVFIILVLVIIIISLVWRHNKQMENVNKENSFIPMSDPHLKMNGVHFAGQFNPAFGSLDRNPEFINQPQLPHSGGEVPFGYRDSSREHHFARNSLHEASDNMVLPRPNDFSNGVQRQPLPEDYARVGRMSPRESQFVERNPDYHIAQQRRESGNGYNRDSRNSENRHSGTYGGQYADADPGTYIYRPNNERRY